LLARFGLYDFFANIIPGIFFLWALGTVLGVRDLREALPLTGGLAETSVLIVIGYLTGLLLQGVSQTITERALKWWWGGFPSERWLLAEDERLTAEYKAQLGEAASRRFGLALDLSFPATSRAPGRKARMKRNQEIFYRCYRSVEKASDQPQTFNAQYGLFRGLLTTFLLLTFISLGLVAHGLWVARSFVPSPHLAFTAASMVGGIISYQRTKKRGEDFAKAVLDVFLVTNTPPSPITDAGLHVSRDRKETSN
jgi:hypothetical protein